MLTLHRVGYFDTNAMCDEPLTRVTVEKDVGIIFQNNFKFDVHSKTTVNNAFRVFGFILPEDLPTQKSSEIYFFCLIYKYDTRL